MKVRLALALAVAVLAASCAGRASTVEGVVIEVTGDLDDVTAFEVVTDDGSRLVFVPAGAGILHGLRLSHLSEHLLTADPVRIEYEEQADGTLLAVAITDTG